jgi:Domain of unknown function (DUF4476)
MRLLLTFIAVLFISFGARSQHHHFFYIQSDQQQTFYIKIGSEVLSSSSAGFLIIPKLKDSAFDMIVGFPKDQFPEYRFKIAQVKKDRGMSLKNFGDKGWGLFDLQTLEVQMGEKIIREEPKKAPVPQPITNDAFTVALSSVIDDPGLMATELVLIEPSTNVMAKNAVVVKETLPVKKTSEKSASPAPKPAPDKKETASAVPVVIVPPSTEKIIPPSPRVESNATSGAVGINKETEKVVRTDTSQVNESMPEKTPITLNSAADSSRVAVKEQVAEPDVVVSSQVGKISEQLSDSVLELVFTDTDPSGKADTIRVSMIRDIPNKVQADIVPEEKPAVSVVNDTIGQKEKSVKDVEMAAPVVPAADTAIAKSITSTGNLNKRAACKQVSSEKDLAGLRKRMVPLKDEDDMVMLALKDFKQKCYTTEQVRNLTFVFVRDEGRYKLLDAAYPYVYDPDNFSAMESLLSDPYFIHRFRALVKKPVE